MVSLDFYAQIINSEGKGGSFQHILSNIALNREIQITLYLKSRNTEAVTELSAILKSEDDAFLLTQNNAKRLTEGDPEYHELDLPGDCLKLRFIISLP